MVPAIFRHLRYKQKHLVRTTFNLTYYTTAPKNGKPHEKRRSNSWAYTSTKTHINTTINKIPLATKPMQIFILQIHDQFHQNIDLPIEQKHVKQPLWSHINWWWILSRHQKLILCLHLHEIF